MTTLSFGVINGNQLVNQVYCDFDAILKVVGCNLVHLFDVKQNWIILATEQNFGCHYNGATKISRYYCTMYVGHILYQWNIRNIWISNYALLSSEDLCIFSYKNRF